MDILEFSKKRDNLRVDLCGKVSGYADFIRGNRSYSCDKIFIDGILEDVAEYTAAVKLLEAELASSQKEEVPQ